jgi:uncharacterized protein YycO
MELKAPKIRRFILKTLLPITKWIGTVSFPYTRRIKDVDVIAMEAVLKPGMVLGSYARGHASNLVIPGRLKHIAIYRGVVGGVHTVIEALGPGVQTSDFVDFAFGKDLIYIFNPLFATPEIMAAAAELAVSLVGDPYDFLVEYSTDPAVNKAFYCSEIPWWSYDRAMASAGLKSPFTPRETMGVATITPDDYANAKTKWAVLGFWGKA